MAISDRIESIEEHLRDDYSVLELAGADLTNVDKNILNLNSRWKERLLYFMNNGTEVVWENWDKVVGEGTSLSLNRTLEAKMKIELKPSELYQDTTTGKNLFNYTDYSQISSNTTISQSGDTTTLSTTSTTSLTYATFIIDENVQEGNTYRISAIIKGTYGRIRIRYYQNDTWNTGDYVNYDDGTSMSTLTYSPASGVTKVGIFLYCTSQLPTGSVSTSYDKLMITKNNTDTTYEPYTNGASPNPDYPQEIHSISGDNEIKVVNKNLQSGEQLYQKMYSFDSTHVSEVVDGNINAIKFNPRYYRPSLGFNFIEKWKENTQYTIRCLVKNLSGSTIFISVMYTDRTTGGGRIEGSTTEYTELRYTTENNKTIQNLGFSFGVMGEWLLDISSWFVGEGDTTDYVPHQEQSLPLNLGDLEYCKIGNYKDNFFKAIEGDSIYDSLDSTTKASLTSGMWYLQKNVGKVVLDGTQTISRVNWRASETSVGWLYPYSLTNNAIVDYSTNITKADKLLGSIYNDLYNMTIDNGIGTFNSNSYGLVVRVKDTTLTTATAINNYLSTNNITVYYDSTTPTYTLLSDTLQTQLENIYYHTNSYNEQTNISQENNDLPSTLNATALEEI